MREIFTVDCRFRVNKTIEDSTLVFIGSTERKCMNFIKKNDDYCGEELWYWAVCREYIDCDWTTKHTPKETGLLYWVDIWGNKSNDLSELIDFRKKKYLKENK